MTRNESFKRRVRARMAHTGEKYNAARRVLFEQAAARDDRASSSGRHWVADPGHTDEAVRTTTGRGWDEWCDLIEAWPGHDDGHGAVAAWLQAEHGVSGWWAQAVTVGWERITGRRLKHQMADGTFTANRSATITTDPDALRSLLVDDDGRAALFPGMTATLRSRPTAKTLRLGLDDGVAQVSIAPRDDGRVTVSVSHEKLGSPDEVTHWKAFWGEWLTALDDA